MKRLTSVGTIVILLLWVLTAGAGPLEFRLGAGPSAASFGELNAGIGFFNSFLSDLNNNLELEGTVPLLDYLSSGFAYQAGQWFFLTERFALGGKLEHFRASTSTSGTYTANDEESEIDISLDCFTVGFVLGARYMFLDAGIRLFADLGVGYYFSGFTKAITFEMPDVVGPIAGSPQEGEGRYTGLAFGFEGGLSLSVPITDWFEIGTSVFYRALTFDRMRNPQGEGLDLDGDGNNERVDLSGITVLFTFSIKIDLSL